MNPFKVGQILEYIGTIHPRFTIFVTEISNDVSFRGTIQTASEGCKFRLGFLEDFGIYPFRKLQ